MALLPKVVILFGATAGFLLAVSPQPDKVYHQIDNSCVGCICEASLCNGTATCHTTFKEDYWCGPFLISIGYWKEAGSPVILNDNQEREGAFHSCVNDYYCAADTVRRYMNRYANDLKVESDCNGDGVVDCIDFGSMHLFGYKDCKTRGPTFNTTPFYKRFHPCLNKVEARGWSGQ